MLSRRLLHGFVILVCLQLAGWLGPVRPVWADAQDLAMFYDSLAPYGKWVDYGKYGPVWYPTQVASSWRPYLDGRWTPSHGGWVFETSEPWGWATYHYGNWMPTTKYGWVWSPGSTWYPSTAAWRTSDDYVGWAPTPPPDYEPEPAFYPEEGYTPGAPLLDLLAAPLWIFARAADFLLGFGEPFGPAYSYHNCYNCLAPLGYAPIVYGGTFLLNDFYYPGYAPGAFYCFGPPFPFISRVSRVNIVQINNYVNTYHYGQMRNVLPPAGVMTRHPFLREAIPGPVLEGRRFPITRVQDVSRVEHELTRPGVLPPLAKLPAAPAIPKYTPTPSRFVRPENLPHMKGMALPHQASMPLTPSMRRQIGVQRRLTQPPTRIETRPEFRPLARPEVAPRAPATVPHAPPQVMQAPGRAYRPAPRPSTPEELRAGPSREYRPPSQREVRPAPSREFRAPAGEGFRAAPPREFHPPSQGGFRPAIPREFRAAPRPAPQPAFHPPAPRAVSPAPRGSAPARPSAPAAPAQPFHK